MTCKTSARPVRVLVMEDHERMRAATVAAIDAVESMDVVADTGSVREALALVALHQPDVVVLDVHMPDGNGIEVCRDLHAAYPDVRCVIFTSHEDLTTRRLVAEAGAASFVLKTTRVQDLTAAIAAAICS